MKRKALGKGLSALLPDPDPGVAGPSETTELALDLIEPNPVQPRTAWNEGRLAELAASIRESGIVQPLLVRPVPGGRYQIVAGERRWRAARMAGLPTVPVSVRAVPDERLLEMALVENIQRQELSPLEEAQAFVRLQQELSLTQEEVAKKVGRDRSTIANTVRLLRLPDEVKGLLDAGRLEAGHARALLALDKPDDQAALGREAARKGWSVREVESRVALARAPRGSRPTKRSDPNTRAAEERLRQALGTRVQIARRGGAGQIRVHFKGEAELNRIYETILRATRQRA